MSKPIVTALIDTYNHERFLEQAIVSVLIRIFPASEMEILVVDDGSTDRASEIVRKFEPRVRYLRKENGGQASAFNFGIPQAQGEIVAFLDGDDWWATSKLSTVVNTFDENPDVGAIGHGYYVVDEAGKMCQTVVPEKKFRFGFRNQHDVELFCQLRCFLGTSKVAYRRAVLERVLPVPEVLRFEADEYMWTIAAALTDALVLDLPLFFYRFHASNFYMQRTPNNKYLQPRLDVMQGLADELPAPLKSLGVPPEIIATALEQIRIDVKRLRLMIEGGMPWETYSLEKEDLRRSYSSTPLGYRIYKELSLLLALALPPQRFYQVRQWYAANNLRRMRSVLGEPKPMAPVTETAVQNPAGSGKR